MKTVVLGRSGIRVGPVVLGGWQAGGKDWGEPRCEDAFRALRAGLEAGADAVDTAESYGNGQSERVVGRAVAPFRDRVTLISKVFANHLHADAVEAACKRSLANLGTDRIDLYMVHWPPGSFGMKPVPAAETMGALSRLREAGKIRAVGLCNFGLPQLEDYARHGSIDAVSAPLSLFFRNSLGEIAPWCAARGIAFLAYSPLAQGFLAGNMAGRTFPPGDHRSRSKLYKPDVFPLVLECAERLRAACAPLGISPAAAALAWVLARPGTAAVAGARNEEQARENVRAGGVVLSGDEAEALARATEPVARLFHGDPLMWAPPGKKRRI